MEKEETEQNEMERCFVCLSQQPRYTCPACRKRTCSMPCVQQHKIDTNCTGRRNPAAFIDKKSMGDRMLLSDYRFLEDGNRKIFSFQKEFSESTLFKPYPNSGRNTLFQQAMNRGFIIWGVPLGMSKRAENSTTFGAISRTNKTKIFKFHVRWTIVLNMENVVISENNIFENWNVGRIAEEAIGKLSHEKIDNFINPNIKVEIKDEFVEEAESDENGHLSASSIESGRNDISNESKNAPIELGQRKYSFEVFMKRVQGTEKYYHIDKDKSIRENLNGKVIVEFPDFLIVPEENGNYYFDKVTNQIDYKKGQKPIKPPNFQDVKVEKSGENIKSDRADLYDWKDSKKRPKCSQKKTFNSSVDLSNVVLQQWQKEALKQSKVNQKSTKSDVYNLPKSNPVTSPMKRMKTEGELKKEIEDKKRSLKSVIKFFDTSTISSDEEEEEED